MQMEMHPRLHRTIADQNALETGLVHVNCQSLCSRGVYVHVKFLVNVHNVVPIPKEPSPTTVLARFSLRRTSRNHEAAIHKVFMKIDGMREEWLQGSTT